MKLYLYFALIYLLIQTILCHHPKYRAAHERDSIPHKYIIEFEQDASTDFLHSMNGVNVRRTFEHKLFQGVSIEITDTDNKEFILGAILDHPDIAFVSPNRAIKSNAVTIKNNYGLSPNSIEKILPHEIHQVDRARKELNLTGEGIFVGIIDTGVDYTLDSLGGGFGEGYKIAAGYDFVGYDDPETVFGRPPKNDSDPMMICNTWIGTHGTHIAGIIAGDDPENKFEGVAPKAKLGMWRALDCAGAGDLERLMEGLLAAFDAGVHIISYSIGYNFPWNDPEVPDYKVFKRMTEHGIFVAISASNNGEFGAFTVDGLASSTFSVASAVNKYRPNTLSIRVSGIPGPLNVVPYPYVNAADNETTYPDGELFIASAGKNVTPTIDSCDFDTITEEVQGKVVLMYTNCPANNAVYKMGEYGAAAILFYTISDGEVVGYLDNKFSTPIVTIPRSYAEILLDNYYKNNGSVSVEFFRPEEEIAPISYEKTISLFSSVGPTVDLGFSPNIATVGESVYSTLPRQFGGYGIMSGTSMSAPYLAGTLALYLEYHGINKTKPEIVLAKFKNYAAPTTLREEQNSTIESPLRQGSGLVQIYDTITQSVYIMPPEISFKDSTFEDAKTQQLTITNEGNDTVTYKIYNNVSAAVAPYNISMPGDYNFIAPSGSINEKADIEFSVTEISVGPGESRTVTVKVVPPATNPLSHIMYGGYIQFSPESSDKAHKPIHVPYFGIVGDQKQVPILNQESFVFAYSSPTQNYSYAGEIDNPFQITHKLNTSTNTTLQGPFIYIEFSLFGLSKFIKAQLVDHSSQQVVGDLTYMIYWGTMFPSRSVTFDGSYCPVTQTLDEASVNYNCNQVVSNGTYVIQVSALKLFGDIANGNDYEVWTSIPFTIETV